jgi:hypothetical protein
MHGSKEKIKSSYMVDFLMEADNLNQSMVFFLSIKQEVLANMKKKEKKKKRKNKEKKLKLKKKRNKEEKLLC